MDVVYDHFLATDETEFSPESLLGFSRQVYSMVDRQESWLPARFAAMYPYMKSQNWLFHYRSLEGAGKSMGGVVRRSQYLTESDTAYQILQTHYQLLQEYYRPFWADMKRFAREQFDQLQESS